MGHSESYKKPQGPWVLVAEDNADISELISTALTGSGYRVLTCTRSNDALRILDKQRFGCLILDCHLEEGTADQIVLAARKDRSSLNYQTPILLMSGDFDLHVLKMLKPYIKGAILKPFQIESIVEKITSVCPSEP